MISPNREFSTTPHKQAPTRRHVSYPAAVSQMLCRAGLPQNPLVSGHLHFNIARFPHTNRAIPLITSPQNRAFRRAGKL